MAKQNKRTADDKDWSQHIQTYVSTFNLIWKLNNNPNTLIIGFLIHMASPRRRPKILPDLSRLNLDCWMPSIAFVTIDGSDCLLTSPPPFILILGTRPFSTREWQPLDYTVHNLHSFTCGPLVLFMTKSRRTMLYERYVIQGRTIRGFCLELES